MGIGVLVGLGVVGGGVEVGVCVGFGVLVDLSGVGVGVFGVV